MKQIFPKNFSEVASFFKDLIKINPVHLRIIVATLLLCLLPAALNLLGFDFGIYTNFDELTRIRHYGNENETFRALHAYEKGSFVHTILETICVLIAIFTVIFAFIIYEVKNDIITVVIGTTLFCAGILDGFHILASDQLIWAPDLEDVTNFTWFISRTFNSSIILFASIIILTDNNFFDRLSARSIYQVTWFFILITLFTVIIVFFNVKFLPTIVYQNAWIARPLELIPLFIFIINGTIILPVFYKKNQSIFSFALLISMIPAAATQCYILFSQVQFDNYFIISRMLKAFSYIAPFAGIVIDYLMTHRQERAIFLQLNKETAERRAAQTLLTGVLDSSIDGIISLASVRNEKGKITDFKFSLVNDAFEKLTGYKEEELLESILTEKTALNQEGVFTKYALVAETGESITFEYFFSQGKREVWFSIVAVKLEDGLAVTFKDITTIKEAQEEILHYQKELENKVVELNRSNTELEQFAYIASHDLQEPLRKIQAFGDRLAIKYTKTLQEEGKDYISRMKNAASRMQTLINDLLNFSRVKANNSIENIDLKSLAEDVTSDLETRITQLNATIHIGNLPVIEGDKRQIGQLFQNLISNALKFHRKEVAPKITVESKGLDKEILHEKYLISSDKKYFEIKVSDNGIGFDNKYLDKIFTIFQRLHGRTEYEGTGIGLAICRKVVENHKGVITANSILNAGTTFYIVLPEKQSQ